MEIPERWQFKQPNAGEFEEVKKWVEDFWLDDESMDSARFRVLVDSNKVIAFGRLRENIDATELCTLGVVKEFRGKGLGRLMVECLLKEAKQDIYVVTVIPAFFSKLGFEFVENYPASMQKKVNLCTTDYHVGEIYRVMKWKKPK